MMRDPHRASVEVQAFVERGGLAGAVLFADRAATHGEDTAAGPGARLEHAAVIAHFAELVRDRHSGQSAAENHDANAGNAAGQIEGGDCPGAASRPRPVIASNASEPLPAAATRVRN